MVRVWLMKLAVRIHIWACAAAVMRTDTLAVASGARSSPRR